MKATVTEAKGSLTELVRRAEAGEEVVLTRRGTAVARLTPVRRNLGAAARRKAIETIQARAAAKMTDGANAARSQDYLYDENGLPR